MTDPKQDVRSQFEAAMHKMGWNAASNPYGYESQPTAHAWIGYQAALQSPAVRELVEAAQDVIDSTVTASTYPDRPCIDRKERDRLITALRTLGAGRVE